jgi:hypothetical protein
METRVNPHKVEGLSYTFFEIPKVIEIRKFLPPKSEELSRIDGGG